MPLTPYRGIPAIRPPINLPPTATGRPSQNLGHIANNVINTPANLFAKIGLSNPIPFSIVRPNKPGPGVPKVNLGNTLSAAITAVTRPTMGLNTAVKRGNIGMGDRVQAVIDTILNRT
jgi:hypothetical protein